MLPSKRARYSGDSVEDSSKARKKLHAELESMKVDAEIVENHTNGQVLYRPTYRAVLASKGYLLGHTLGSGTYSKVKFAHCFGHERDSVAVKIIDRGRAPSDFLLRFLPREMSVWPKLRHPHIIRMLEMFQYNKRLCMILECAENGDVLRYIQKHGAVDESQARTWGKQIGDAVRYLHEQSTTHRDLKLENLLLDRNNSIKICDFGFVKENSMKELSNTFCGSKAYAAPEILKGQRYDPRKTDIWAIGVILFILVTGKMPFDESKGNHGVLEDQKKLFFPWQKYKFIVSDQCKSLLMKMFTFEYSQRPDIHDTLSHNWFRAEVKNRSPSKVKSETTRILAPIKQSKSDLRSKSRKSK